MEGSRIYYIYDDNQNVKEIRTRLLIDGKLKYVIQYPKINANRLMYRPEFVSEERFYAK
jgi:hypothetical protein